MPPIATPGPAPPRNRLLASLPAADLDRLRPRLARVPLVNGQVLHERGEAFSTVYFIEEGMASMVAFASAGGGGGEHEALRSGAEVGVVGREGLVGAGVVFGPEPVSYNRAMVQMPGSAQRTSVAALREAAGASPALFAALLRYAGAMLAQASQGVACNGRHALPERLARWVLAAHDRADGDELPLRHDFLALMLASGRPAVTLAVGALQTAGLVRHGRGRMTVLDREGLERAACDCHGLLRDEFDRLLGPTVRHATPARPDADPAKKSPGHGE